MGMMASQVTSLMIVYSTVYSGTDQRKHQSSTSLAFVRGIHRWIPRTNGQLRRKCFHLMTSTCTEYPGLSTLNIMVEYSLIEWLIFNLVEQLSPMLISIWIQLNTRFTEYKHLNYSQVVLVVVGLQNHITTLPRKHWIFYEAYLVVKVQIITPTHHSVEQGWRVTKPISSTWSFSRCFGIKKKLFVCDISCPYLAGIPAAQIRQHKGTI